MSFSYYPGQTDYLARTLALTELEPGFCPGRLFAAATGCGKTLMAITAARLLLESEEADRPAVFSGRGLIIAPGGTLRAERPTKPTKTKVVDEDDDGADGAEGDDGLAPEARSQWRKEIARFAPAVACHELFDWDDYLALLRPDGTLPPGLYVTYYEAIFRNGARESLPESWLERGGKVGAVAHAKLCEWFAALSGTEKDLGPMKRTFLVKAPEGDSDWMSEAALVEMLPFLAGKTHTLKAGHKLGRYEVMAKLEAPKECWAEGVGETRNGIRCVIAPCLAERIEFDQRLRRLRACDLQPATCNSAPGSVFDMVCLDEAHTCNNIGAQVTQALVRLQPRYRFAFTATPITNLVSGLFCLLGWLAVPRWHEGERRNAAWPYAREDEHRFNSTFLTVERDYTQEKMTKGLKKCVKFSPVISSPARLLKLAKPILAYIGKQECNPAYQPPSIVHVRVPLGAEQAVAYRFFLNRGNISGHPLVRARKQVAYLRALCADPKGFARRHGGPVTRSNFNAKTIAILGLIRDILAQGEQVNIVSARVGQSDELARRLTEAGIPFSRIDSTIPPDRHGSEAEKLKSGAVRVQLMGAKCAASHSFSNVRYQIICSLEYTWGALDQACGRIDRVNSRPGVTIYVVLHQDTMEEGMFDRVATKGDAATICLLGKRVPREFNPVDAQEILADNIIHWEQSEEGEGEAKEGSIPVRSETDCEREWPALLAQLMAAAARGAKQAAVAATPADATAPALEAAPIVAATPWKRPVWLDRRRAASAPAVAETPRSLRWLRELQAARTK